MSVAVKIRPRHSTNCRNLFYRDPMRDYHSNTIQVSYTAVNRLSFIYSYPRQLPSRFERPWVAVVGRGAPLVSNRPLFDFFNRMSGGYHGAQDSPQGPQVRPCRAASAKPALPALRLLRLCRRARVRQQIRVSRLLAPPRLASQLPTEGWKLRDCRVWPSLSDFLKRLSRS